MGSNKHYKLTKNMLSVTEVIDINMLLSMAFQENGRALTKAMLNLGTTY